MKNKIKIDDIYLSFVKMTGIEATFWNLPEDSLTVNLKCIKTGKNYWYPITKEFKFNEEYIFEYPHKKIPKKFKPIVLRYLKLFSFT